MKPTKEEAQLYRKGYMRYVIDFLNKTIKDENSKLKGYGSVEEFASEVGNFSQFTKRNQTYFTATKATFNQNAHGTNKVWKQAFDLLHPPQPVTLNAIAVAFNIPLKYYNFITEVHDKKNPEYLVYLIENRGNLTNTKPETSEVYYIPKFEDSDFIAQPQEVDEYKPLPYQHSESEQSSHYPEVYKLPDYVPNIKPPRRSYSFLLSLCIASFIIAGASALVVYFDQKESETQQSELALNSKSVTQQPEISSKKDQVVDKMPSQDSINNALKVNQDATVTNQTANQSLTSDSIEPAKTNLASNTKNTHATKSNTSSTTKAKNIKDRQIISIEPTYYAPVIDDDQQGIVYSEKLAQNISFGESNKPVEQAPGRRLIIETKPQRHQSPVRPGTLSFREPIELIEVKPGRHENREPFPIRERQVERPMRISNTNINTKTRIEESRQPNYTRVEHIRYTSYQSYESTTYETR